MNILPASRQEWLSFLLFPFKAYAVIVPIWLLISTHESFYVRDAQTEATEYILAGYALCVLVFFFAALIQFFTHYRRAALMSIIFAAATFIVLAFLLPMCALAK